MVNFCWHKPKLYLIFENRIPNIYFAEFDTELSGDVRLECYRARSRVAGAMAWRGDGVLAFCLQIVMIEKIGNVET